MRRNGSRVWVSWANKPLFDEGGQFIGLLAIGTDITDRRWAEMQLVKLNDELEFRVEERTNALNETLKALTISTGTIGAITIKYFTRRNSKSFEARRQYDRRYFC